MKADRYISFFILLTVSMVLAACGGTRTTSETEGTDSVAGAVPQFNADSAMQSIRTQCAFGPRIVGSEAHEQCGLYIMEAFSALGLEVEQQKAEFTRYDGVKMQGYNIIAHTDSKASRRLLIAAHWDSRPWADRDANEANRHSPVPAANDGASGVAVMIEIARVLKAQKPAVAIDFVCFDAEDAGTPAWDETAGDDESTWCLGSQYWAARADASQYRYGTLLDMVGGRGAHFYQEAFSKQYASHVVEKIWQAARTAGFSTFFPREDGGYITDDHLPVNRVARIPMADIVPYYPAGTASFGPTWHTLQDTPENIDPAVLKAVGQTLLQLIYTEQ